MRKIDGFSVPGIGDLRSTVVGRLVGPVDRVRDIATKLGVRAYTVSLVRTRWTGGSRGEGQEIIESVTPILPTPLVREVTSMHELLEATGTVESGVINIRQISGRYTEDQLNGKDSDGNAPDVDQQFWWEVQYIPVNGTSPQEIRRFQVAKVPEYMAGRVYWQVYLRRAYSDRNRVTGETA